MRADEFDAFHAGTYARVVGHVTVLTADPGRAPSAVDEAYALAWVGRRSLGRDVPPETWVRRTATRLVPARSGSPDASTALARELAALPDAQRRAVVLRHLCGLGIAAVAEELGVRPEEAEALLAGGVRALGGDTEVQVLVATWSPPDVAVPSAGLVRRGSDRRRRRRTWRRTLAAALALGVVATTAAAVAEQTGWSLGDLARGNGPDPDGLDLGPDIRRPSGIPDDFPLALGLSAPTAGDLTGPAPDVATLTGLQVCGRPYELLGQVTDRLALVLDLGDGTLVTREVVLAKELDLSPATLAAEGILERFVALFESCPTDTTVLGRTVVSTVEPNDLGERGWTVTRTTEGAEQEILEAVLVGNAVLVARRDTTDLTAGAVARDVASLRDVVEAMCLWSSNGCDTRDA